MCLKSLWPIPELQICGTNPKEYAKSFENRTTVNSLAPGECTFEVEPNSTSKSLRTELTAQRAGWDLRLQPNWVDFLIKLTNKNQCSSEYFLGLVRWLSGKESSCSCRRHKR